eukprot:Phypoly_transcript_13664.p1 GENE.Phypoly_transcript_13664~~Phypoly_transcript_13664.p1  ORF type:complete len:280 (+),score=49.81 Phypoly_transcript_13664:114-953(+)
MDLRFWVRLCACALVVFSIALLVVTANGLRIYRQSQDDVAMSLTLISNLFNGTGAPDSVPIPFETWNEVNLQLYAVVDRWDAQVALSIAGITLVCLCFALEIAILLLPYRQKGEKLSLLPRATFTYQSTANPAGGNAAPRAAPVGESSKKLAMMCEGALYEPWNQATLDKLSGEDTSPATKVTRAIYRYGPIAGKILMRRFGHLLTAAEITEIERILNFGQDGKGPTPASPNISSPTSPNMGNSPTSPTRRSPTNVNAGSSRDSPTSSTSSSPNNSAIL